MDNFLILAHARSGSTNLCNIFQNQGISIICEPYNAHRGIDYLDYWGKNGFEESFDFILQEYDGVKHLYSFTTCEQTAYMKSKCRTIFLYRRNLLDAAISLELAFKTDVWLTCQKKDDYMNEKINLDVNLVQSAVNHLYRHKKNESGDCFVASYEDIYMGNDGLDFVKGMFDFIGRKIVDEDLIRYTLDKSHKINDKGWSDLISNWSEICEKVVVPVW